MASEPRSEPSERVKVGVGGEIPHREDVRCVGEKPVGWSETFIDSDLGRPPREFGNRQKKDYLPHRNERGKLRSSHPIAWM